MNRFVIKARSLARQSGLKRLYYSIFRQRDSEKKFRTALVSAVRPGDVVWDIGANHGIYTRQFCEWTGPGGRVFAFEPVPGSFEILRQKTSSFPWCYNEQVAIGDEDGEVPFAVSSEDYMSSLAKGRGYAQDEHQGVATVMVQVMRGDTYWKRSGVTPNVIKIDVEGFEEEVLLGMGGLLAVPELRAVLMEVHFEVLETRQRADAPIRIEKLLRTKGFVPKWVDASHIAASR
jgi:FkbM family methyltransferase